MGFDFERMRADIVAVKQTFDREVIQRNFDIIDRQIDEQITRRKTEAQPIPEMSFADMQAGSIPQDAVSRIKQRGCVIIRGVFKPEQVDDWNTSLMRYVEDNNYFEKQREKAGLDNYFGELGSSKPQIFGLYWSRAQMEARQSEELAKTRSWLNRLWHYERDGQLIFNPDQECLYADRVRQREPGDRTLGLSPHVDGGSVERWLDATYRDVYRHVLSGDITQYDPFDALHRTETEEIPSPAVCRMFRTFQGWTALTKQGPGNGTLNLVPMANAMAWMMLRALQDDVEPEELCGALPGRAMPVKAPWHEKLLQAYVPIPTVEPGDTVWWHPDVIHGVEDHNKGPGYSNVFYIGAAPDCAKNRAFLELLRPAFEKGESSPDFAPENYEVDFNGRFQVSDLSTIGRAQLGYAD